jgi:hypothetical protein
MKRIEMVELIASVHADWQMLTANETMSFPDVEFAEFLLTNIENAGMLPPVEKEHWLDRVETESPQLTSKVDKDGNYVFDQKEVNDVLLWAIKKSKQQ